VAAQVLLHLQPALPEVSRAKSDTRPGCLKNPDEKPLDPNLRSWILKDFQSNETLRQQHAVQLLAAWAKWLLSLLIEIVKGGSDLRIRQHAASLLSQQGYEAAKSLKRVFMLESTAEERRQILDVIDNVTRDLKAELVNAH